MPVREQILEHDYYVRSTLLSAHILISAHLESCRICLELIVADAGKQSCCGAIIHRQCAAAWRRSSLTTVPGNRGLRDEYKIDTRRCPVGCGFVHQGGATVGRMFGDVPLGGP